MERQVARGCSQPEWLWTVSSLLKFALGRQRRTHFGLMFIPAFSSPGENRNPSGMWGSIDESIVKEVDLSKLGHWSGTGMMVYG